jgi:prepilin-type N-terminal cleavage/methylation domain-containing protein
MRRARGFTLIELMIALALAGMVVGGALQLHIAFNRQSQRQQSIAEIQQTLRVSMQLLEKAIRTAGQGLGPTHKLAPFGGGCAPTYYGFQWSNANAYADPPATYFTNGNNDTDPDWFRVVASDTVGETGVTLVGASTTAVTFYSNYSVGVLQNWANGDLFVVLPDYKTDPVQYTPPNCSQTFCATAYQVTTPYNGTPTQASPGSVGIAANCWNPAATAPDKCLPPPRNAAGCALAGAQLRHVKSGGTVYRILDKNDADFPQTAPNTPKLVMSTSPFGTASSAMNWTVLADNVEDMQIAVILADGTLCGASTAANSDNPAGGCNFANALAVRVTLTARSASPQPSVSPSPTGGYEDEPTVALPANPDGFIRRALTTTIILRNYSP